MSFLGGVMGSNGDIYVRRACMVWQSSWLKSLIESLDKSQ